MNKTDLVQLSSRIKDRRKTLGYTQEELAEKINLSHSHYSKIENSISSPSLDTLIKISKVLGMSLDSIVFGEEEKQITDINITKLNNIISNLKENNSQKISDLKSIIEFLEVINSL